MKRSCPRGFFRAGRLLYSATTWAGYIGILTAQREGPERYGAAVNFRSPDGTAAVGGGLPVGLAVRQALERNESFQAFVEDVAQVPTMAPFYCLAVSGARAVQLTRGCQEELRRRELREEQVRLDAVEKPFIGFHQLEGHGPKPTCLIQCIQ